MIIIRVLWCSYNCLLIVQPRVSFGYYFSVCLSSIILHFLVWIFIFLNGAGESKITHVNNRFLVLVPGTTCILVLYCTRSAYLSLSTPVRPLCNIIILPVPRNVRGLLRIITIFFKRLMSIDVAFLFFHSFFLLFHLYQYFFIFISLHIIIFVSCII